MAARLGKDWNKDDHHAIMGTSTQGWVDYMIKRWDLSLSPKEVEDEIAERMVTLYESEIPFLPGAVEAVKLASANFPTGLASGSLRKLIDLVTAAPEVADKFRGHPLRRRGRARQASPGCLPGGRPATRRRA